MFAEEFCYDLCDPRHVQSALQTNDRAIDLPKVGSASRRSIPGYIQIQIEPRPPRSDGNDWIASRRQKLMSLRPVRALPLSEIPTCESYSRQRHVRSGRPV